MTGLMKKGHKMFLNSDWKLQSKSDRTGYRLKGPKWSFTKKNNSQRFGTWNISFKYY
ncbi:MAG: hypothetical protein Ct9H300mP5_0940 [Candidatus Pelagibacterales bacterium]|nr:MAG: hypothetical protein Ct9H300mP5_0940 [Pelagibacterales bacterium]